MEETMERVKIKICGIRTLNDIHAVNAARPDYIGFVFAESFRRVSEEEASHLKACLNPGIPAVGVFVNEEPERIIRLCRAMRMTDILLQ
jgi:phosphoribosylanthranilate isomerase